MRLAPIRRRAVLDARLAGGQLLAMQYELLVLVLGGLLEVRQSETGRSGATTLWHKAICISFAGDAFLRTRTIFDSSRPVIHSSQCQNFETRLGERLLPTRRAASPEDSWTKVIAKYSSSARPASVRRRRVTHIYPLNRLEPSALQARARNRSTLPKQQRLGAA